MALSATYREARLPSQVLGLGHCKQNLEPSRGTIVALSLPSGDSGYPKTALCFPSFPFLGSMTQKGLWVLGEGYRLDHACSLPPGWGTEVTAAPKLPGYEGAERLKLGHFLARVPPLPGLGPILDLPSSPRLGAALEGAQHLSVVLAWHWGAVQPQADHCTSLGFHLSPWKKGLD